MDAEMDVPKICVYLSRSIEIVEFTMSLKPRHSLHMDWTGTAAVQLGGGAWEFQDAELAAVARAAKCR